ncbi:MAG TPA: cyclic nucleotide-binding domain-containing protein [Ilumatobacteraceae bacterium]|nr:cyclic nucleotide-binding domain-containing protein [Ilumatobacteraceae bacterium]
MTSLPPAPVAESRGLPGSGRSLFVVTFVHAVVEFSIWITILVAAYDRGGAAAAGVAVAAQLLPAALLAPVVTAAGDRFRRDSVLTVSFAVLALSAGLMTVGLAAGWPFATTLVSAAVFTVSLSATPGSVVSLLVHHARSPRQLLEWNIGLSMARAGGSLAGPLLTAVLLAISSPWVVTVGVAALCGLTTAVLRWRLPVDDREPSDLRLRTVLVDSVAGVKYAASAPGPRRVVGFVGLTGLLLGAIDVIIVAVAYEQLEQGGSASAVLAATLSAGALIAAVMTGRRTQTGLTVLTVGGVVLLTLPLAVLTLPSQFVVVVALIGLIGAGNALVEIGTFTLLQRCCSETLTSRVFGIQESAFLIASSLGAAGTGIALADRDLASFLAALGVVSALVLTAAALALRRVERASSAVDPELVASLRTVPFLEPLPLPTLEHLASRLVRLDVAVGATIIRQGDDGHHFYVLLDGAVTITVDGSVVERATAPASFGETALLRDQPRAATVTADAASTLAVIERAAFLAAIERSALSRRSAIEVANRHQPPTVSADSERLGSGECPPSTTSR